MILFMGTILVLLIFGLIHHLYHITRLDGALSLFEDRSLIDELLEYNRTSDVEAIRTTLIPTYTEWFKRSYVMVIPFILLLVMTIFVSVYFIVEIPLPDYVLYILAGGIGLLVVDRQNVFKIESTISTDVLYIEEVIETIRLAKKEPTQENE